MMTGPDAFAPAEAVLAEEEALEPAEPEHPESAIALQTTSRAEAVMTRRGRFTGSSLRGHAASSSLDHSSQYQLYGSADQPKMASAVMRNAGFSSVTELGTLDAAKKTTGAKVVTG